MERFFDCIMAGPHVIMVSRGLLLLDLTIMTITLLHAREVGDKIDRAIAQADRGEGMTPEQSRSWLEEQKAAWRKGTARTP